MMMKAIRVSKFGGPEELQIKEAAKLSISGANQLLIRMGAAGINPVDAYIRTGTHARKPNLPYTPGSDGAGVIEAVSDDLKKSYKVGQRVYVAGSSVGTYSEYAICDSSAAWPLPDHITLEQGAALNVPYGTAYRALFQRGQAKRGETLLIHGASGGVGIAAIQWAKHAGLRVFGTASTTDGLALITANGADGVANHAADNYRDSLMKQTGGLGFDIIIENLANVNLGHDLPMLAAKGGRVMVVGSRGPVEINARDAMSREADIRGVTYFAAQGDEWTEIHTNIVAGLKEGYLNPVVGVALPLEQASKAHEVVMKGGHQGKVVLRINPAL